jgi:phenylpyruvate tautomerase PptA (4-oxalocrotonate tautomerase family)
MPTYTCQAATGLLDQGRRAAVARAITTAHAEVTGAPAYFAQVLFQEIPQGCHFIGGEPLGHDHLFVHGRIRAGRPPELRRELIRRLVADVATAAGLAPFGVWVYLLELPAGAMAEFGRILPEPGGEAAWAASFPDDERDRMTRLGREG